ncbi:MAG: TRAP transporter small permease subunit [Bilophila wadsworthia]
MSSNAIETPPLAAQLESLSALIRRTEPFCQRISAVGMYIFMGLVILTFADVLLRYVIGSPISGSIEITEMLMSVVLFSSVAYTYWRRGHVSMDIVTGKLSELNKNRLGAITTVWSLAVVFFCITCMGKYAMTTTDTTSVWNMSYKPFIWFAVFGCVLLFLAMLSHLLDQLAAIIRGGGMGSAFLMLGIGLLGVALSVWVAVERLPGIMRWRRASSAWCICLPCFSWGCPWPSRSWDLARLHRQPAQPDGVLNLFGTAWFSTCSSYTGRP